MRITFLVPGRGLVGGIKVMGEYAGHLRARDHDVAVLYRRTARNFKRLLQRLMTRRTPDALDDSGCTLTGVREFTPETVPDADVMVTTGLRAVRAAAALPPGKGRVVEIVQGTIHMEEDPAEARKVMALPVDRVAVSDHVARYLKEHFGVEAAVVLNGVDHSQFYNNERQFRTPRTLGMIYAAGDMKGTAEAFDAVGRIRDRWPGVRLVLYGAKRPRRMPPRTEMFVRPKAARLRAIYAGCEVWLAPSRSEGFGLPVLEAMACGVVPVATRAGGHECIIEDGVSGFLVPVGDDEAMAKRIALLIEDESILRTMSGAARERSLAFDWETSTDQLEALLDTWTGRRDPPPQSLGA
ncbi:MAG TPA: glycosyltransferase family 4 protein [Phycisphaerae bacterium]|nr:glycosyltransferase family 4 protein [Phycisphaerae bacterium]